MANTNVPLPQFTDAGLTVPTEPEILAGVFNDWVSAFADSGRALNTELTTPQGQLAQSQAYMLAQLNARMAQLIASVDPLTASGAFQDALGKIYFLTRQGATYASVMATVTGVVGQTLPAGSQARSADGSVWASTTDVTFNSSGTATAEFRAVTAGDGPAVGVNGLTIYQQRPGWESISNATASIPGTDVESRQSFETRRSESVNIGGQGTAAAVRAAIANVTGVTDAYVYNNGSDAAITYGATSYPIPAHSIAVTVAGGADADIAQAIHSKLDAGCGLPTTGGRGSLITQTIQDDVNYVPPYPRYQIRFVRPAFTVLYVRVTVADLGTLPSTYVQDVQNAITEAITNGFATADRSISVSRARIGGQIVAAAYLPAIQATGRITPVSITVGTAPNPTSSAVTLGIDQVPVISAFNVTVIPVSV